MDLRADAIAGVVDLFGGLTRGELREALGELAFKRGEEYEPADFDDDIDAALESFHLVSVLPDETDAGVTDPLLVTGPVAFPELPEGATDLPHILDVDERAVDRATAAAAAKRRFEERADDVTAADDTAEAARLLDVSYELEAWGTVDLTDARARLSDVTE
jgi:hypothetical protein